MDNLRKLNFARIFVFFEKHILIFRCSQKLFDFFFKQCERSNMWIKSRASRFWNCFVRAHSHLSSFLDANSVAQTTRGAKFRCNDSRPRVKDQGLASVEADWCVSSTSCLQSTVSTRGTTCPSGTLWPEVTRYPYEDFQKYKKS